ncbi:hypothetical protein RvY_05012 [Ramazzottius varieornatus]|uniref:DNA/RNA-binding protein Alba-like domain-containing protein n=1 Tax=Ramazzottius varieornatus TaxID=947166 RepID=A0A1D1UZA9_RAMVA|nr:hypothetical protein RvY_05012 [Ramazzottius varieornatus]
MVLHLFPWFKAQGQNVSDSVRVRQPLRNTSWFFFNSDAMRSSNSDDVQRKHNLDTTPALAKTFEQKKRNRLAPSHLIQSPSPPSGFPRARVFPKFSNFSLFCFTFFGVCDFAFVENREGSRRIEIVLSASIPRELAVVVLSPFSVSLWGFDLPADYPRMENYQKGETVDKDIDHNLPFSKCGADLTSNVLLITVRGGSKIQTLLDVALQGMNDPSRNHRHVVFFGEGPAIGKTISCVEILKRRIKHLHQINKVSFHEIDEIWNPKLEGLKPLKVARKVPMIHVLLSKDPLNQSEPGYQQ